MIEGAKNEIVLGVRSSMNSCVRAVWEWGVALLFPEVCQCCYLETARKADGYVCARCWQRLRFVRHPFCERCGLPFEGEVLSVFRCGNCSGQRFAFQAARSAVVANEFSLELVHRYKYGGAVWLEGVLADLLWNQLCHLGLARGWDILVPVPLFPTRERQREFNQAARIASIIAQRMGVSCAIDLLKRVAPTSSQTMLTRSERRNNVRSAFAVGKRRSLRGLRVMLVDDVFTTGATTNACARVLKGLGAAEVWVCTVVRGL